MVFLKKSSIRFCEISGWFFEKMLGSWICILWRHSWKNFLYNFWRFWFMKIPEILPGEILERNPANTKTNPGWIIWRFHWRNFWKNNERVFKSISGWTGETTAGIHRKNAWKRSLEEHLEEVRKKPLQNFFKSFLEENLYY